MIKKATKIIFENGGNKKTEELIGGLPLSKGETVKVHEDNKAVEYEVTDKIVEAFLEEEQIVNITYILRKKSGFPPARE